MTDTTPKNRILKLCAVFAALCLLAAAYCLFVSVNGKGIPCVFNAVTHLKCPGCGNSRAALALLHFDFAGAVKYNALFPLEFAYIGYVFICDARQYIKTGKAYYDSPYKIIDIITLTIVLLWFIARNIIGI